MDGYCADISTPDACSLMAGQVSGLLGSPAQGPVQIVVVMALRHSHVLWVSLLLRANHCQWASSKPVSAPYRLIRSVPLLYLWCEPIDMALVVVHSMS